LNRKIITAVAAALIAVIAPASASAQSATVVKETVTIASCSVATTTAGVPATCRIPPSYHKQAWAERVFSIQFHVKSTPSGQVLSETPAGGSPSLTFGIQCVHVLHSATPPAITENFTYANTGIVTPWTSSALATPYRRYCTASISASVPTGLIHAWITAVIVKGARHSTP
jgi:hypothetical protein